MENKLKKNLYILIIMNISLLSFGILYTLLLENDPDFLKASFCIFKDRLNLYCPACGASRSIASFLRFNFISSFLYYPPIIISAAVIIDYDRRLIMSVIRKNSGITDRFNFFTFIIIPIAVILTFFIRNILLLFFGIDTVGDFIP